jgi:hypothetical protein
MLRKSGREAASLENEEKSEYHLFTKVSRPRKFEMRSNSAFAGYATPAQTEAGSKT